MTGEQISEGRVCASGAEPGAGLQAPPIDPGLLGLGALEAVIMEVVWAAGSWVSLEEIRTYLEQCRSAGPSTAETVAAALVRKGLLIRASRDGGWGYRAAATPAGYLGQRIGRLLGASPDRATTLAQAGITEAPAGGLTRAGARIAVFYDGYWYQHADRYFAWDRGELLSVAGLHDAIRWHAAGLLGCPVQQVTISHALYVVGDVGIPNWWEELLPDHGVICHQVPVAGGKELGGDVELALACYQLACETDLDLIVLLAGDGDFAPLAARLAGRGLRVLVPTAKFIHPGPNGSQACTLTSEWLTRRASDTPALTELLAAADSQDYPPFLAHPFPTSRTTADRQPGYRTGTVTHWAPGSSYGFIAADDGLNWFAHVNETPRHVRLSPGCPVAFTGLQETAPGQSRPRARDIKLQARQFRPLIISGTEAHSQAHTPAGAISTDGGDPPLA